MLERGLLNPERRLLSPDRAGPRTGPRSLMMAGTSSNTLSCLLAPWYGEQVCASRGLRYGAAVEHVESGEEKYRTKGKYKRSRNAFVRINYTKDATYAKIRTTVPGTRQLAALASIRVMRAFLGSALLEEEGHLASWLRIMLTHNVHGPAHGVRTQK